MEIAVSGIFQRIRRSLLIAALGALGLQASPAQADAPAEYDVKAAYLFNFIKFVEWPANAPAIRNNAVTICILGEDPFGAQLESVLSGQTVDGKPLKFQHLQSAAE